MSSFWVVGFFIEVFLFALIYGVGKYLEYKENKKINEHQTKILDLSMEIDIISIISNFEAFVELTMKEYLHLNVEFKNIGFINTEMEADLLRNIAKEVKNKLSPYMIGKLSLVYNIQNEEQLNDIITQKVYIKVLKYVTETNAIKNNNDIANMNFMSQE